jgi:hypothetical protein
MGHITVGGEWLVIGRPLNELQFRFRPTPACGQPSPSNANFRPQADSGERRLVGILFEIAGVERQGGLASSTLRLLQPPRLSQ